MKFYVLQINLGNYEAGRIIAFDGSSWMMADNDHLDTRGSIGSGELAMLLNYANAHNLTTILEPLDKEE